jgi:hypothetical protein
VPSLVVPRVERTVWTPLPVGPVGNWRCPVAGCLFAAIYPMHHPCPLRDPGQARAAAARVDPIGTAPLHGTCTVHELGVVV